MCSKELPDIIKEWSMTTRRDAAYVVLRLHDDSWTDPEWVSRRAEPIVLNQFISYNDQTVFCAILW